MGPRTYGWTRSFVCGVSIVTLAWFSVGLVLQVAAPTTDESMTTKPAALRIAGPGQPIDSTTRIFPIFGVVTPSIDKKAARLAHDATHVLRGLFETRNRPGFAVIESAGVTAIFREHDRLPSGEVITKIDKDGVTFAGTRGPTLLAFSPADTSPKGTGKTRTMDFPTIRTANARAPTEYSSVASRIRQEQRPSLSFTKLREQALYTDALSTARFTRVRTHSGKTGFRIGRLPRGEVADVLGLRSGDVVFAVNGMSVDDPQAIKTFLDTLPTSREVMIELERRRKPYRLVVPLTHE